MQETRDKISNTLREKYIGENSSMFGKHHSDEAREKMSKSAMDRIVSEEARENMRKAKSGKNNPMFGRKHAKEAIEKMKKSMDGKYAGENSPNWIDGRSFGGYCPLFNYKFKEKIRDEFNRECFICGLPEESSIEKYDEKLSVHHVNYNTKCLCEEDEENTCYFVPLCKSCHSITNFNKQFWEKLLIDCCNDPYMMAYFDDDIYKMLLESNK